MTPEGEAAINRNQRRSLILLAVGIAAFWVIFEAAVRAPAPTHMTSWSDPYSGMEFVLLRAGTFKMGTPADEPKREAGEALHEVTLSRPFYLGRYEVMQGEWDHVMGDNPSFFKRCGDRCPVEQVTWHDVQLFIRRLNERSSAGFRLPTEAEWEYACRANGLAPFGRASSLSSRDANINGNFPYEAPIGEFRQQTTPAGRFAPNPWGLFDVSGNVWEWVQDAHCPYPEGSVTDPKGECESPHRVIRGGSWLFDGGSARCGLRYTHRPQDKGYSLGLRLARDVS